MTPGPARRRGSSACEAPLATRLTGLLLVLLLLLDDLLLRLLLDDRLCERGAAAGGGGGGETRAQRLGTSAAARTCELSLLVVPVFVPFCSPPASVRVPAS